MPRPAPTNVGRTRRRTRRNIAIPKFAAQAIRKAADIGWKPAHYLNNVSASVASTMKPASFENSQGILTAACLKNLTDLSGSTPPR
jgi:hypothetical protein